MKVPAFAKLFDHSIVRPDASRQDVCRFAETAVQLATATLTVQPHYIPYAAQLIRGSGVLLGTVVGFPHGNETPSMKQYQAREVLDSGAEEIDMVMNIPALKNGEEKVFMADIEGVVRAAEGRIVKVITENSVLTPEEKRRASQWIARTGAHFVKTSTAYMGAGASLEDVRLMVEAVNGKCQVKAAGGIRQLSEILDYLRVGARRFGSTRTDQFVAAYNALAPTEKAQFNPFLEPLS